MAETQLANIEQEPINMIEVIAARVPAYTPRDFELLDTARLAHAITCADDRKTADTLAGKLKVESAAAKKHFEVYTKAADALHGKLVALRKAVVDPYEAEAYRLLSLKTGETLDDGEDV